MKSYVHVALAAIVLGAVVSGCTCDEPASSSPPAATSAPGSAPALSASATPRTPRPTKPAPEADTFTVTTSDGVRIEGSMWSAGHAAAPAVVLVHRLGGTRAEWTPLIERLFPSKHPMNVVAFDLRGHGASKSSKTHPKAVKGQIVWPHFEQPHFEQMDRDLDAVANHLKNKNGGPPQAWVLVGSDLGATLALRHADKLDPLAGVALVSPGASLRGLGLYEPFAAVLHRPNLIITAVNDNVSHEPAQALARMSKSSKLVSLEARGHGAQFLGDERWEMWDELADWVEARLQTPELAPDPAASGPAGSSSSTPAAPASSGR